MWGGWKGKLARGIQEQQLRPRRHIPSVYLETLMPEPLWLATEHAGVCGVSPLVSTNTLLFSVFVGANDGISAKNVGNLLFSPVPPYVKNTMRWWQRDDVFAEASSSYTPFIKSNKKKVKPDPYVVDKQRRCWQTVGAKCAWGEFEALETMYKRNMKENASRMLLKHCSQVLNQESVRPRNSLHN
jgi:hypothetical protein